MTYSRPAIQVSQEFQNAAASLALPNLPACIIGPGFQVKDDVDVGVYTEAGATVLYTGLHAGAVVDVSATPTETDEANVHKRVKITLKDLYVVDLPVSGANPTTGALHDSGTSARNLFYDATSNAFDTIDPAAVGAPRYYVEIISGGVTADHGRKYVLSKVDANTLLLATEWDLADTLPVASITYRVLEYRAQDELPEGHIGVTATIAHVVLAAGVLTSTDSKLIEEAEVYLAWRALRPDLANTLNVFRKDDDIVAIFGTGSIVPANIGAYAIHMALLNTATSVSFTGLSADWISDEELAYADALEYLESKDVYVLAPLTQNVAVHQIAKTHVELMSVAAKGRERVCFINRRLVAISVITPPSGLGYDDDGSLSGTLFKTFRDTDATFIYDGANPGDFVEVVGYVAAPVAPTSVTKSGTGASTSYGYKIVAVDAAGHKTAASAETVGSNGPASLGAGDGMIVTWGAVAGAAKYEVWRTTGGTTRGKITEVTAPAVTYTDVGAVGGGGTAPVTGQLPSTYDTALLGARHEVASVDSPAQLSLAADPTGGASGVLITAVHYRVTHDMSRDDEAALLAGYATSLGSRRVVSSWPDILAVSINAVATPVPGFFAGAVFAGMTAGLPSQQGFTNLTLTGFVGRENSDDRYTDDQLDIIAGGGNLVLTQPVEGAALLVRHQVTTDMSTIYFQEYSVTKNVDLVARFFRGCFSPYLGIYNITDGLFDLLKSKGQAGIGFLKKQRVQRIGAPLRSGQLTGVAESDTQPDTVEVGISIDVPLPLNHLNITLLV